MSEYKLFKYAVAKKKNRRIDLVCFRNEDYSDFTFVLKTKKLIGDWKDRNILESSVIYGYDSLVVISALIDLVSSDIELSKLLNPMKGQMSKDKFEVHHNMKRKS